MSAVAWATLVGTILILVVSGIHLYLGQVREPRSQVTFTQQAAAETPSFRGGSRTRWNSSPNLKLTNTGERGAFIASVDRELIGLRRDGDLHTPDGVEIDGPRNEPLRVGDQIDPHTIIRYRPRISIEVSDDPEVLVNHETALIRHRLTIEDNKGSYEITEDTDIELYGPRMIRDEYHDENSN